MNPQYMSQPPPQQQTGFGSYHNPQGMVPPFRPQPPQSGPSPTSGQLGKF